MIRKITVSRLIRPWPFDMREKLVEGVSVNRRRQQRAVRIEIRRLVIVTREHQTPGRACFPSKTSRQKAGMPQYAAWYVGSSGRLT